MAYLMVKKADTIIISPLMDILIALNVPPMAPLTQVRYKPAALIKNAE
jgi:hypothetical protein